MPVTVDPRGPLFDGRAEKAVADAENDAMKAVATIGASMVRSRMAAVFRKETPFYRFANVAAKDPPGWKIWDQDKTLYGWWLEGVSSRNRTTRFKGYRTYRIITQQLRARAQTIADGVLRRHMDKMQ